VTVTFRNVDVDIDESPDSWPFEAILTVYERGVVSDWRHLVRTIRVSPWGPCARAVETITSWREHPGHDELFVLAIDRARSDYDIDSRQRFGERIRQARRSLGMSQRVFSSLIGTSAQRLSSYESGSVAPTTVVLGRIEQVTRRTVVDLET
jgi:DNA-binding XRE family transcriptional regulator